MLVASIAGLVLLINLINVLITVLLAVILAEAIRPAIAALQRRRVPRPLAILLLYLLIAGAVMGAAAMLVPPLIEQVRGLAQEAPRYFNQARQLLPGATAALQDLGVLDPLQGAFGRLDASPVLRGVAGVPAAVVGGLFNVLSGFVLAAFWLGLTETVDRTLLRTLTPDRQLLVRGVTRDLSQVWGGWLRGQLLLMVFVGGLSFVGLLILDVQYPVALAVWAGLTEIFPIIGPWIGAIPAVVLATLESPPLGAAVFLLYLGVQQVENSFLVPKVMQRAVGLHPFLVLVALLMGGSLLGIAGVIISVPVAAAIQVVLGRLWLGPPPAAAEGSPQQPSPAPPSFMGEDGGGTLQTDKDG